MKIVRKMPNTANTATKLCLLIMTCLLLVMTVMSGTWAILYYTYSCSCNSEDVIQGDKKSATRTNIEILSIDNRKESVEVDEGDQKSCPQVQDTDCLTTWSLLEILVVILICYLTLKSLMNCVLGSHGKLSSMTQKKAEKKEAKKKRMTEYKAFKEEKTRKEEPKKVQEKETEETVFVKPSTSSL